MKEETGAQRLETKYRNMTRKPRSRKKKNNISIVDY